MNRMSVLLGTAAVGQRLERLMALMERVQQLDAVQVAGEGGAAREVQA